MSKVILYAEMMRTRLLRQHCVACEKMQFLVLKTQPISIPVLPTLEPLDTRTEAPLIKVESQQSGLLGGFLPRHPSSQAAAADSKPEVVLRPAARAKVCVVTHLVCPATRASAPSGS